MCTWTEQGVLLEVLRQQHGEEVVMNKQMDNRYGTIGDRVLLMGLRVILITIIINILAPDVAMMNRVLVSSCLVLLLTIKE